jgi:hypothetical protein
VKARNRSLPASELISSRDIRPLPSLVFAMICVSLSLTGFSFFIAVLIENGKLWLRSAGFRWDG